MIHALDTIINFFTTIFSIVIEAIQTVVGFFVQVARVVLLVGKVLSMIPTPFVVAVSGVLGILLVINILNKGG